MSKVEGVSVGLYRDEKGRLIAEVSLYDDEFNTVREKTKFGPEVVRAIWGVTPRKMMEATFAALAKKLLKLVEGKGWLDELTKDDWVLPSTEHESENG